MTPPTTPADLATIRAEWDGDSGSSTLIRRLVDELTAAWDARDDALDSVDELEKAAEIVSVEFEKECWIAVRSLLERIGFDVSDQDDGVTAQEASDIIHESIRDNERAAQSAEAQLAAAKSRIAGLEEGLRDVCNPLGYIQRRAEAEGKRLSGEAYGIANSLGFVQGIARALLSTTSDQAGEG